LYNGLGMDMMKPNPWVPVGILSLLFQLSLYASFGHSPIILVCAELITTIYLASKSFIS
jgi:hypothetical protein